MSYSDQVVSDCYHEAAHAVFYRRAGIEIIELYVYGEGKIWTRWPTEAPPPEQAMALAAGCLAGPLSSYKLNGHDIQAPHFEEFLEVSDFAEATARMMEEMGLPASAEDIRAIRPPAVGDDYEDALEMLRIAEAQYENLEACYVGAVERVRVGLEFWWPEIRAVAEELLRRKRLAGSDVVRLMDPTGQ